MDRNTLTGLVLMAAILFGFMYLNKPDATQNMEADVARMEQTAEKAAPAAVTTDTITPADLASLREAILSAGTVQPDGSHRLTTAAVDLTVDSAAAVAGTIHAGKPTGDVSFADLAAGAASLGPDDRRMALETLRKAVADAHKYKAFAGKLGGENVEKVMENDLMRVTFSSRGGRVSQVELKNYKTELTTPETPIRLFRNESDGYSFVLTTADQRLNTSEFNFTPVAESDTSMLMKLELADGAWWGIRYSMQPGSYLVRMQVVQEGMASVLPASTATMGFHWHQTLGRNEKGRTFEERNSSIRYKYAGEGPEELSSSKDDSEELTGRVRWVAFTNQFFSSVLMAKDYFSAVRLDSKVLKEADWLKDMDAAAELPYSVADGAAADFCFYFGPNDYPLLSDIDDTIYPDEDMDLTSLVPLGWGLFRWINQIIVIPVFDFLGRYIANYGIIILLLTLFIKLILFPFTYKSYKSQARMRVLAPEITAINEKYPGQENAMKRQQETMALYSRAGASPMSGCLPMLLQMPVLIAMFSFFPSAIELRGQSFLWAHDLSAPDYICTLPFTIPFYGNQVSLFCLLMTIANVVYTTFTMQNQPGGQSMPGMKWMMYLMPVMFLFFFNDYASALSYYYLLSLLITIIQTTVTRHFVDEKKVRAEMEANARKPRKKSGFMARLEAAQKQQEAAMRAQAKANARKNRR
ncbi:MAG: membrane protein insertase YidC [Muribaculaceae bacterium]|nr:membrane protein insertase YidC [Muribaculaceae bacterium]